MTIHSLSLIAYTFWTSCVGINHGKNLMSCTFSAFSLSRSIHNREKLTNCLIADYCKWQASMTWLIFKLMAPPWKPRPLAECPIFPCVTAVKEDVDFKWRRRKSSSGREKLPHSVAPHFNRTSGRREPPSTASLRHVYLRGPSAFVGNK